MEIGESSIGVNETNFCRGMFELDERNPSLWNLLAAVGECDTRMTGTRCGDELQPNRPQGASKGYKVIRLLATLRVTPPYPPVDRYGEL